MAVNNIYGSSGDSSIRASSGGAPSGDSSIRAPSGDSSMYVSSGGAPSGDSSMYVSSGGASSGGVSSGGVSSGGVSSGGVSSGGVSSGGVSSGGVSSGGESGTFSLTMSPITFESLKSKETIDYNNSTYVDDKEKLIREMQRTNANTAQSINMADISTAASNKSPRESIESINEKIRKLETNPSVILFKNFLNYFINIENAAFLYAIIEQDMLLVQTRISKYKTEDDFISQLKPDTKFMIQNFKKFAYDENYDGVLPDKVKDKYKVFLDEIIVIHNQNKVVIDETNYIKIISEQAINEVNTYSFTDLLTISLNLQNNNNIKLVKNNKIYLTEKNINEKISNILNIKMILDILSNMTNDDIIIVLTSPTSKTVFSQLYVLDYIIFFVFRMISLGIYFLYNEDIYKTQDVILRLKIIENIQNIIISFIKKLRETIKRVNMGDTILEVPTIGSLKFTAKKTYNQLLDSILNNMIIPTKIINLFNLDIIKSNIIKDNKIEYFGNLSEITEKYKNVETNKKYFWIILLILIVVLLVKYRVFNKINK